MQQRALAHARLTDDGETLAGAEVEMRVADGRIEMEPAPLEVRLEREGGLLVAVPVRPVPPMPASVAVRTAASLRGRRPEDVEVASPGGR